MKIAGILLFLFQFSPGFTQGNSEILMGRRETIYSDILNEQREIWIFNPNELGAKTKGQNVYPVVYLLDGEYNFHMTSGILEFLSRNDFCPEMILVGIISKNRERDFTPTHVTTWPSSGGAENFLRFIENELIPHINANYPTASYQMLIGHSLGGLFAIYSMIHSPEIFNSYIAIDPSIHWDDYFLADQMKDSFGNTDLSDEVLYLPFTFSDKSLDSLQIRNDNTATTEVIRAKFEFYDMLDSLQAMNGIQVTSRFYKNETHSVLPLISIYDGMNYTFGFYRPPEIQNNIDTLNIAVEKIRNHYEGISNRIGFRVLPPDNLIDALLYLYYINDMDRKRDEVLELRK